MVRAARMDAESQLDKARGAATEGGGGGRNGVGEKQKASREGRESDGKKMKRTAIFISNGR